MSNDYFQLRKDVDRIKWFITGLQLQLQDIGVDGLKELFEEFSQNTGSNDDLYDDLDTLDKDLTYLSDSLIDFNQALLTFNGDTENLSSDLGRLSLNLNSVLNDLSTLDDSLTNLDGDLDNLKTTIHIFAEYLTNFNGTLTQFKAQLAENDIEIDELDQSIIAMFDAIDDVNNAVTAVEDDIGDTSTQGTVKYNIAQAQSSANTANNTANTLQNVTVPAVQSSLGTVQDKMYGKNSQGTVDNPTANSVMGQIDTVTNTDIPNVKTKMGYSAIGDDSLQSQIVTLFNQLWGFVGTCHVVANESDKNSTYCKKYCKYVYVQATGKYYENTGEDILGG